jgi:hypothetical protein
MPAIVRPGDDYFSSFSTASAITFELEIDRVKVRALQLSHLSRGLLCLLLARALMWPSPDCAK